MNTNNQNILLTTDSYKITHWKQYPENTRHVFSYFESRGGVHNETTFFGLQYILEKYLSGKVVTKEKIEQARDFCYFHFGDDSLFNLEGWNYILEKHCGYLPLKICAVKEGTTIPTHNVLMTVENTDPNVPWLTNYVETILCQLWYPTTVCTQSREMKKIILKFLEETGDPSLIDFKLHDFGFRGSTSCESSAIGSASHLVNFKGTDTISGIDLLRDYYYYNNHGSRYEYFMPGYSIPAAEHSTITSHGKNNEVEAYRNMLKQYGHLPLVAVVSDSYDIFNACENIWGGVLKQEVLDMNATLVIRPDSGDPEEVLPKCLDILADKFGGEYNKKGYFVLNPKVRLIQGDGVDLKKIFKILELMKELKYSADNISFGSGGGLLQQVNRDTQKFAFKCSSINIDGKEFDVYKDPITDSGKKSKRGRITLVKNINGDISTIKEDELNDNHEVLLNVVFEDGFLYNKYDIEVIRNNAKV